jgi:hypothetical protein
MLTHALVQLYRSQHRVCDSVDRSAVPSLALRPVDRGSDLSRRHPPLGSVRFTVPADSSNHDHDADEPPRGHPRGHDGA